MLQYRSIQKSQWTAYFKLLSKLEEGRLILLELIGNEVGDQIEEDWSQFHGVFYDTSSDTLIVRTHFNDYPILFPQSVMTVEDGMLRALGIRDAEDQLQIIHFRHPLMLEGTVQGYVS